MSSIHYPWGAVVGDTKPVFKRKRRKDGSLRKARVFGKPWWFETAGWSLEKCEERRTAILERLKERWPDLTVIKNDGTDSQEITDWIKPLIATFNDSEWCLPKTSDTQKRFDEQLSIYTAWAKFIIREASRVFGTRQTSNPKLATKTSLSTAGSPDAALSIPDSEQATILMTPDPFLLNPQRTLPHQWGQSRNIDRWSSKGHDKTNGLASQQFVEAQQPFTRFESDGPPNDDRIARSYSFVTSPNPENSTIINNNHILDSETEVTETSSIADSTSLDSLDTKDMTSWGKISKEKLKSRLDALQDPRWKESTWRDRDWDDVVVKIDATAFDGERYPIPMTMLKPGSHKEVCRWDDFELDKLYSRFEVESGQAIDRAKYTILLKVNGKWTPIKTPGQYKLMLKQFSRATRITTTMTLSMRVELRSFHLAGKDGQRWNGHQGKSKTKGQPEKSQFTGAASDFSSESDNEISRPLKRHKQPGREQVEGPAVSEPIARRSASRTTERGPPRQLTSPLRRTDQVGAILKVRESPPEEFTQESQIE